MIIEIKKFKEVFNIRMDIAKERICELEDEYEEIRQAAVQTKRWKI